MNNLIFEFKIVHIGKGSANITEKRSKVSQLYFERAQSEFTFMQTMQKCNLLSCNLCSKFYNVHVTDCDTCSTNFNYCSRLLNMCNNASNWCNKFYSQAQVIFETVIFFNNHHANLKIKIYAKTN
jgi:hypothetical protein